VRLPNKIDTEILKSLIRKNNDDECIHTNTEICKHCGGACCKNMGCHISPNDLEQVDYNTIIKLLQTGFVSIDWWVNYYYNDIEFVGEGYYLRIRNKNSNIVDPSEGGICKLLTNSGCSLDFKHRPKGGRMLSPDICKGIKQTNNNKYSLLDCVNEWNQYHDLLWQIRKEYNKY